MSTKIDVNTESTLFYKPKKNVYNITYVYNDSHYIVSNVKSLKRLLNTVFVQFK